jgi:hypothetical protein
MTFGDYAHFRQRLDKLMKPQRGGEAGEEGKLPEKDNQGRGDSFGGKGEVTLEEKHRQNRDQKETDNQGN